MPHARRVSMLTCMGRFPPRDQREASHPCTVGPVVSLGGLQAIIMQAIVRFGGPVVAGHCRPLQAKTPKETA